MKQKLEKEKLEAIKLWSQDPCGAHYVEKYGIGSEKFFSEIIKYRYENYAPWLKKIIDLVDAKRKKVLEIGCGMGIDLLEFAKNGAVVTGIDLVDRHLELTRRLFNLHGKEGIFFNADAENLPFPPESFDIVYSFGVLHHTPNIQKAINEIHRILKPKGTMIMGLYHKNSWHYWINLIFIRGILKKELRWNWRKVEEILSTNVEFSRTNAQPLVKVYSRTDCHKLFKGFSKIEIKTYHFKKDQISLPKLAKQLLPSFLPSFLGWYLIITATK